MEVCNKCHERDKETTGCTKNFKDHYPFGANLKVMRNDCMICGKLTKLCLCPNYKGYNVREPERKLKGKKP